MAYFTDAEGEKIHEITPDNLEEYKNFIDTRGFEIYKNGVSNAVQYLEFNGVEISDLFKDKNGGKIRYSEPVQTYLGQIIGNIDNDDEEYINRTADTLLELSAYMPEVLKNAFAVAGNRGNSDLYHAISDKLKNRTISQNMPALLALYNHYYLSKGKAEGTPTKRDVEYFEKLYAINSYNAKEVVKGLASTGFFINEKLSPELRKEQNDVYFSRMPMDILKERVNNANTEIFDMNTTGYLVFGYGFNNEAYYGKPDEHGRIGDFDKKLQEILLNLTNKIEPHDKANGGKEKTLNRRFQEMAVMLWNGYEYENKKAASFAEIPYEKRGGIIRDMYVKTAMRDVKNGRAADLDKDALQAVLNNDPRGFYLSMLPKDLLADKNLKLNRTQQEIVFAGKDSYEKFEISNIPDSMVRLSMKQKEEILEKIAEDQKNKSGIRADYERRVKSAEEDKASVDLLRQDMSDKQNSASVMVLLQKQYAKIMNNIRGDDFSKEEHEITKEAVNSHLQKVFSGEYSELKVPEYGHLPLFHRAGEIERRARMTREITAFNELVKESIAARERRTPEKSQYDSLLEYAKQGLLSAKTLETAENDIKSTQNMIEESERAYRQNYNVNTYETMPERAELDSMLEKETAFKHAQARISQKKHDMQEKARENVLPPKESALQSTDGVEGQEKHDIRAQNKKVIDPLQARMEKSQRK